MRLRFSETMKSEGGDILSNDERDLAILGDWEVRSVLECLIFLNAGSLTTVRFLIFGPIAFASG